MPFPREAPSSIPTETVILLSGVPATGKTEFSRYLAREHGFAHYDLECYPRGWPRPELKELWDVSRSRFLANLRKHHDRVVLDWGFPPSAYAWVEELREAGAKLVWFEGDVKRARECFVKRGGIAVERFDEQLKSIENAGYPTRLDCIVVPTLSSAGAFSNRRDIERMIFT